MPVDADIARDVDVPLEAIRISDFTQPLAVLPGHVKIVILDAARQNPFACGGEPFASVLALVDPPRDRAVAFNAAPGTVAPDEQSPYGAYATALTEMIAAGGLTLDDTFARVRLRVSDVTQGVEIPWYASQTQGPFFMTERVAGAPPLPNFVPLADIRNRPMRDFGGVEDANAAALAIDTIAGYEQFLSLYPNSPYSRRVAAMLAVRREAIVWRRCVIADTPPAYWSYLRRYPRGPHAWDARRRLAMLRAEFEPPPDFAVYDFGMPPPPDELVFVDWAVLIFEDPEFRRPPPPPPFFLPPRPREFAVLPPPPPPRERFFLPTPSAATVPNLAGSPRNTARRSTRRHCVFADGSAVAPGQRTRCTRNAWIPSGGNARSRHAAAGAAASGRTAAATPGAVERICETGTAAACGSAGDTSVTAALEHIRKAAAQWDGPGMTAPAAAAATGRAASVRETAAAGDNPTATPGAATGFPKAVATGDNPATTPGAAASFRKAIAAASPRRIQARRQ